MDGDHVAVHADIKFAAGLRHVRNSEAVERRDVPQSVPALSANDGTVF